MKLDSAHHSQLRLLHYPAITNDMWKDSLVTRLPAHTDWGAFTMLFQDKHGGLELREPHSGKFLHAEPEEGTLVLNVGDMMQRFTNGMSFNVHSLITPWSFTYRSAGLD